MEKTYTVYCHTSIENGKKYIGITCNDVKRRWAYGAGYTNKGHDKSAFAGAIKKYGWDGFIHEILFTGLTVDEASSKEQELIKELNTQVPNGYNILKGGVMTPEEGKQYRKRTDNICRGDRHFLYGKHRSKKCKERISSSRGYKVVCVETNRVYNSAKQAADEIHQSAAHILEACRGINETCGGFHWAFADDEHSRYKSRTVTDKVKTQFAKMATPICAINVETGEQINFPSVSAAELYFDSRHISDVLNGKRHTVKGHKFYRQEEEVRV